MTLNGLVRQIMQEVNDLSPWATTYRERPADLLEVSANELEDILRSALVPRISVHSDLIEALRAYMEPAGDTPQELRKQAATAIAKAENGGVCGWFNGLWCDMPSPAAQPPAREGTEGP